MVVAREVRRTFRSALTDWLVVSIVASVVVVAGVTARSAGGVGAWSSRAAAETTLQLHGAAAIDSVIYQVGGITTSGDPAVAPAWTSAYDAKTDTWSRKVPLTHRRAGHAVVAAGGKIYAIGGVTERGFVTVTEEYDPATNAWAPRAALPKGRADITAQSVNGVIYAIGGTGKDNDANTAYDIATDTWSAKRPMPTGRQGATSVVLDGLIYVIGGFDAKGIALGTVESYDPATDKWTKRAPLPTARGYASAAVANGTIYAIGGKRLDSAPSALVDAYDPVADKWTADTPMPGARAHFAAATVGDVIYAFGGLTGGKVLSSTEAFTPTKREATGTPPPKRSAITIDPEALPPASVDAKYEVQLNASGGKAPYTFEITAGTLPDGLQFADDGLISGTPTEPAHSKLTVTAKDKDGAAAKRDYTLIVTPRAKPGPKTGGTQVQTPAGASVEVKVPGPPASKLTFKKVDKPGVTNVASDDAGPALPSGLVRVSKFVDITTTATFTGDVTVCVNYAGLPYKDEAALRLLHFKGPNSEDVTTGVDMVAKTICGSTTSFSPFVVAEPAGTWTTKTAMTPRNGQTVVAVGTKIYVIGGWYNGHWGTVQIFDTVGNSWSTGTSRGGGNGKMGGAINGIIYEAGGNNASVNVNTVQAYDPTAGTWTGKTSMNHVHAWGAAVVLNGKLYVIGGDDSGVGIVEVFDPVAAGGQGSWSNLRSLQTPRGGHAAGVIDGKIYVAGGTSGSTYLTSLEVYDPVANTWTYKEPMPTARGSVSGAVANGKFYVLGGYAPGGGKLSTVEAYDPFTDRWEIHPSMPTARGQAGATAIGSTIYVLGGEGPAGTTGANEAYAAPAVSAISLAPSTLPGTAVGLPYSQSITAAGGVAPYSFAVTSGSLPPGLALSSGGLLSGSATTAGSYTFTVTATDASLATGSFVYTLSVVVLGTWATTGNLNWQYGRAHHTATRLQNGKVLVVGGRCFCAGVLSSGLGTNAELYDPNSGSWSTTGGLQSVREYGHTATLLANGRVLVAGGWTGGATSAAAEVYNPSGGAWSTTGPMTAAREAHTATLLPNGKVLVAGGWSGSAAVRTAELYDPSTGTWTATGSMAGVRYAHSATLLPNGRVLVAGGYDWNNPLRTAEVFDPATGSWSSVGLLAGARWGHTATLLWSGKVLVTGGWGSSALLATAELFDPVGGTWSSGGTMSTPRLEHAASLLSTGRVVVMGGRTSTGSTAPIATADVYDPASNTWIATGSMTAVRRNHSATLLSDGRVLVSGGFRTDSEALRSTERYSGFDTAALPDLTPPTISVPSLAPVAATSGAGAEVTFTVAATEDGAAAPVTCDRASGSTFPIGTTTVTCWSSDAHANIAGATFAVTVTSNTPMGAATVTLAGSPTTTLAFSNVTQSGQTTMGSSATGPTPPTGFKLGSPAMYVDITTTATFTGTVNVCISYAGITFVNESALKLWHYAAGGWEMAANNTVDTAAKKVCGDVNSLSPFAALEAITITLSPPTLPAAIVGTTYTQTITASGGTAPYTFTTTGTLPAGVSLSTGGVLAGTPTTSGSYSFTVTATDATTATGSRAYDLFVANAPPVANADSHVVRSGLTLNVSAPGILANDADVENDPLTAFLAIGASNGTLVLSANGSFTYTSAGGFVGTDTFTYRAVEGAALPRITGTKGLWHFNEGANFTAADDGGTNNISLFTSGLTWIDGPSGKAVKFSGGGSGGNAVWQQAIGAAPDLTVEAWVRWDGGTGRQAIYAEGNYDNRGPCCGGLIANDEYIGLFLQDGRPTFRTGTKTSPMAQAASALQQGRWYHLAGVLSSGTGTLYVDGAAAAATAMPTPAGSGNPPTIGYSRLDQGSAFLNGAIDELRILNVARSSTEIAADATAIRLSQAATVTISVTGNTSPSATTDSYNVTAGSTLAVNAPGVLGNDTDADGDPLRALAVTLPSNGTIGSLGTNGSFTYTPNAGFSGTDTWQYRASDGWEVANVSGTAGLWRFNDNAADVTGARNGTLVNGPTFVDGVSGKAVKLNGTDQYVSVSSSAGILGTAGTFTVEAWVRWDGGTGDQVIYSEAGPSPTLTLALMAGKPALITSQSMTSATPLQAGTWHHIAAIVNGSAGGTLFVDGVLVAAESSMQGPASAATKSEIGRFALGGNYFNGAIDEVRVMTAARGSSLTISGGVEKTVLTDFTIVSAATTVTVHVNAQSDLSLSGSDSPDPVIPGQVLNHTYVLTNNGPSSATAATLAITYPSGASSEGVSQSGGGVPFSCIGAATGTTCTLASPLASGAVVTFVVSYIVPVTATGTLTSTASLSAIAPTDPTSANDSATVTTTVQPRADLSISVTDSPDPISPEQQIQYEVKLTNGGPSSVSSATVSVTLAAGTTFAFTSYSDFTCSGASTLTCTLNAALASGATALLGVAVLVDPGATGSKTATAAITSSSPADPNAANNSASTTTTVARPTASGDTYSVVEAGQGPSLFVAGPGILANDLPAITGPLRVYAVFASPQHAAFFEWNGDGGFTYVPALGFVGTDTFTYRAYETTNGLISGEATVTVSVTPVNSAPTASDGTAETNEDVAVAIDLGPFVSDVETSRDLLTYEIVSGPANGTLTPGTGRSRTYTPNLNFSGTDTLTFRVTDRGDPDGCGTVGTLCAAPQISATRTVTITVNAVNDAPVLATNVPLVISEGTSGLIYGLGAGGPLVTLMRVTDVDHTAAQLTYSITSPPAKGQLFNQGGACGSCFLGAGSVFTQADLDAYRIWYQHGGGEGSSDSFAFTVSDGAGGSVSGTFAISIIGVNDAPAAVADAYQATEDATLNVSAANGLLANDTDPEGNALSVAVVTDAGNGTLTLNADGSFAYAPRLNFSGTDTFTYRVSDGQGGSAEATVTITVAAVADPPVAEAGSATVDEEGSIGITLSGTDPDSAPTLTFSIVRSPEHGFLQQLEGWPGIVTDAACSAEGTSVRCLASVFYVPLTDYFGPDSFTFRVFDGTSYSEPVTVTITVRSVNDAPVALGDGPFFATEDTTLTVAAPGVLGNDFDREGPLSAVIVDQPTRGTVTLNADGSFTYVPSPDLNGPDSFTYRASDGVVSTDPVTVTITVNGVEDPPTLDAIADRTVVEDAGSQTVTLTGITGGPAEEATQPVTVTASSSDPAVVPAPIVTGEGTTRTLTFTPAPGANGRVSIQVNASDGYQTVSRIFFVTVTAVNDAPSFTKGANVTVDEDSGARSVPAWATAISAGPADESPQTLTFTLTNDNNTLFSAQPAISSDGTLTFTPASNANGSATVTVTLRDSGGGTDTSAPQTFVITVTAVNDAPTFTPGPNVTVTEDSGAYSAPWATSLSTGPPDESAQTLTFDVSTPNAALFSAQPAISPSGTLTFTPAANANGTATVTVTLRDSAGGAGVAVAFTLTVGAANDAPRAVATAPSPVEATSASGAAVVLDGSASSDVDNTAAELTYTWTWPSGSASGATATVTLPLGTTVVTLLVRDPAGATETSSVTVVVRDTTAPTLAMPAGISSEFGGNQATGPGGAAVSYTMPSGTDAVTPSPTVACVPPPGSTFPIGPTTVTCTATDAAGNASPVFTLTVTVVDTTKPILALPADITVAATSAAGAAVSFVATATDVVDGTRTVVCVPASGAVFAVGQTRVTCTAADTRGNVAEGSFLVTVTKAQTTTTLASAPNPADLGQSVTFTATVTSAAGGTPSGTVTFTEATIPETVLGTGTLGAGGTATYTTSALATGTHPITASYGGDSGHEPSASASLTQTVYDNRPFAAFTANPNPAACVQTIAFDASASRHGSPQREIVRYDWNFGDGRTVSTTTPSANHSFSGFGTYTVTLVVTDNNTPAKVDTATVTVSVDQGNRAPTAVPGGPYLVYLGSALTLDGSGSSDPDIGCGDSLVMYDWSIASGALSLTSTGRTPTLSAATIDQVGLGTHTVTLTVTDEFGMRTTASTTLEVRGRVTASVIAASKTYDGTTAATIASCTLTGARAGDSVTCSAAGPNTFATASAGTALTVTATNIALAGTHAGMYDLSNTTATTTANIERRAVAIAAATAGKAYGGAEPTLGASITSGSFVTTDGIALTATRAPGETVAGSPYAITPRAVGPADTLANYDITAQTANFTITPARLSITASSGTKTYGQSFQVTPSYEGFASGEGPAALSTPPICASEGAAATAPVSAAPYPTTCSGAAGANYEISYIAGTLSVTPATATLSFVAATLVQTYTGTPRIVEVTTAPAGLGGVSVTYAGSASAPIAAGSYPVRATLSDPNYLAAPIDATLSVGKARATVTLGALAHTYDATPKSATATTTPAGLTVLISYTGTPLGAGSYPVTATIDDPNYAGSTSGTLVIDQAASTTTVTWNSGAPTFDGTARTATAVTTGVGGAPIATPTVEYSGGSAPVNAGEHTARATFAGDANYKPSTGSRSLTIARASSTTAVTCPASVVFSGTAQTPCTAAVTGAGGLSETVTVTHTNNTNAGTATASASYAGGANHEPSGDSKTFTIAKADPVIAITPYASTYDGNAHGIAGTATGVRGEALAGLELGQSFTNVPGGMASWTFTDATGNYNDASGTAPVTITPRPASVTPNSAAKTYGDLDPAFSGTLGGFLAGDGVTATYARTPGEDVGAYTISATLAPAAVLANYDITYATAPFTIGTRAVTVTADAQRKTYGDTDPALTYAVTSGSLAFADAFGGTLIRAAGETVGTYAITQGTLALSANYALTFVPAALEITPATLTVAPLDASKTYGETAALSGSITGQQRGDTFTATYASAGAVASAPVGTGSYAITVQDVSGAALANYTVVRSAATLAVAPKAASVTADPKMRTYGDANPELTAVVTGTVNGDTLEYTLATTATAASGVGAYPITVTLGSNPNYAVTATPAMLTVTPRAITVTADAQRKTYGDADPALTYQITAGTLVNGDTFTGSLARAAGEAVGTYAITRGTLDLPASYALTFDMADLTITKRAASVTPDDASKIVGTSDPVLTGTLSGFLAADGVTATYSRTPGETIGAYAISATLAPAAALLNYDVTYRTAKLEILDRTPPELRIQWDPSTKDVVVIGLDPTPTKVSLVSIEPTKWGDVDDDGDEDSDDDLVDPKGKDQLRTYRVEDAAGNTATALIKVRTSGDGKEIRAMLVRLRYLDGANVGLPLNELRAHYELNRDGSIKEAQMRVKVGRRGERLSVVAHYRDGRTDATRILEDLGEFEAAFTLAGLHVPFIGTATGALSVGYISASE